MDHPIYTFEFSYKYCAYNFMLFSCECCEAKDLFHSTPYATQSAVSIPS